MSKAGGIPKSAFLATLGGETQNGRSILSSKMGSKNGETLVLEHFQALGEPLKLVIWLYSIGDIAFSVGFMPNSLLYGLLHLYWLYRVPNLHCYYWSFRCIDCGNLEKLWKLWMEPHCARYAPPADADCTTFLNLGCTECCISCLASDSIE